MPTLSCRKLSPRRHSPCQCFSLFACFALLHACSTPCSVPPCACPPVVPCLAPPPWPYSTFITALAAPPVRPALPCSAPCSVPPQLDFALLPCHILLCHHAPCSATSCSATTTLLRSLHRSAHPACHVLLMGQPNPTQFTRPGPTKVFGPDTSGKARSSPTQNWVGLRLARNLPGQPGLENSKTLHIKCKIKSRHLMVLRFRFIDSVK